MALKQLGKSRAMPAVAVLITAGKAGGRIRGRPRIRRCGACPASGPVLSSVPAARSGRSRQHRGRRGSPASRVWAILVRKLVAQPSLHGLR